MTSEERVREANRQFYRAFESLDLEIMEKIWIKDGRAQCIHPGWPLMNGWSEVRESWSRIFANTQFIKFTIEEVHITLQGDWAWVICLENLLTLSGGGLTESKVLTTNIFIEEEGVWYLVHHHGSPLFLWGPPEQPEEVQ
ncbi:MAG: nuclear transport factor 2 family protein [Candidatus Tectomicrobia bacterium]|uniref:Nuclear transport factor 2 family protein n=1 Tax=Tectimicrobiota bacterium TaxID=2528274 RepID=A0A932GNF9_UNCTE|nr:nuclear transport factor 2 family protein [Candidatus Tectomicrobia bacterium]